MFRKALLMASVVSSLLFATVMAGDYFPPKPSIFQTEIVKKTTPLLLGMPIPVGMFKPNGGLALDTPVMLSSTTASATQTFSSVDIGPTAGLLCVMVSTGTNVTITSVTVAGTALTNTASHTAVAGRAGVYYGKPASTNGNVVVVFSASVAECAVTVIRLNTTATAPFSTSATAQSSSATSLGLAPVDYQTNTYGVGIINHSNTNTVSTVANGAWSIGSTIAAVNFTGVGSRSHFYYVTKMTGGFNTGGITASWTTAAVCCGVLSTFG